MQKYQKNLEKQNIFTYINIKYYDKSIILLSNADFQIVTANESW